jgi:adenylosuccinate lyase
VRRKGANAKFDVARIDAIERDVKHDVIAFLTHVAEIVGPEARYLHQGLRPPTSSTHASRSSSSAPTDLLIADVDALLAGAPPSRARAQAHRHHWALATACTPSRRRSE